MATLTRVSDRGRLRRELILAAAAELMAERGYAAVGITEIGAAAGIVGSGIYRHFDSKARILAALLDRLIERMLEGSNEVATTLPPGLELVDALIARQAEIAIENRSLLAVYLREAHNLPPEDQRDLRREQRRVVELWISHCAALAPAATSDAELRVVVQGVLSLINSVSTYESALSAERLVADVSRMAQAAVRAGLRF